MLSGSDLRRDLNQIPLTSSFIHCHVEFDESIFFSLVTSSLLNYLQSADNLMKSNAFSGRRKLINSICTGVACAYLKVREGRWS